MMAFPFPYIISSPRTAPVPVNGYNKSSIAYHLRMGFEAEPSEMEEDGVPYHLDYDGPGEHRVLFVKHLKALNQGEADSQD
jgi:hypothetical protein